MSSSSVKGRDKTYEGERGDRQAERVELVAKALWEAHGGSLWELAAPLPRSLLPASSVAAVTALNAFDCENGGLKQKLDEMRLHEDTGDPIDVGYMRALAELYEWLGIGVQDA